VRYGVNIDNRIEAETNSARNSRPAFTATLAMHSYTVS